MMKKRGYPKLKVLVTGGSGFIGSNLIPFLKRKYQVGCYDLKNGNDIFDDKFEAIVMMHDIVIHLAALTSVEQSFKHPQKTFMVNTCGTAKVAYLCAKYKKKLIYPSSAAVYFPDLSPYGKSKQLAEQIVKETNDGVVLRLFNVFGPNMNPGSVMYNFIHAKKLQVFGDGTQTRDFIHVRDVCSVIEDSFKSKWNGKIVDVGMGYTSTINYIALLFSQFRNIPIEYMPSRKEIRWSVSDRSVLDTLYKRELTTNLEKDILELCQN